MLALDRLLIAAAVSAMSFSATAAEWNTQESRARWSELSRDMFGANAHFVKAEGIVTLAAPETAQDAALVPVALKVLPETQLRELDLVVDQNPSPVAARIHFGPAGDPREIKLRVRVNAFTNMHAVAVLKDGRLVQDVTYVQGAGGCSAPMGSEADASANMGEMRMKFAAEETGDGARTATLMIRHPNFNGMQMNDKTHKFTPPRYIQSIVVKRGAAVVFDLKTDISLSTNPVITFSYRAAVESGNPIEATVTDTSGKTWSQSFVAPGQG